MKKGIKRTWLSGKAGAMVSHFERIEQVQKCFESLGHRIDKYGKRMAELARKGNKLASSVVAYSSKSETDSSLGSSLIDFSKHLASVQQQQNALTDTIQQKIAGQISVYKQKCQEVRRILTKCENAVRKEKEELARYQKAKTKVPVEPRKINEAKRDYEKAHCLAERFRADVDVQLKQFEAQKVEDLSRIFSDLLLAEMRFHAQALQSYTAAFKCLPLLLIEE